MLFREIKMKKLKETDNLYEYILGLSSFDINELVENSKSEDERKFYLKLEELKTQFLQEKLITDGVF